MSNTEFFNKLNNVSLEALFNNFGVENYDEIRFGKFKSRPLKIKDKLRNLLRRKFTPNYELINYKDNYNDILAKYGSDLNFIYNKLDEDSRDLLINLIAYRILGYQKVKLPLNNPFYLESLEKVKRLKTEHSPINPNFLHFLLERFNLNEIGYDIELYFSDLGIVIDFIIEQYAYKTNGKYLIQADEGDTVLDIGGCWGDTALYFSHKVGPEGKVYSFEFIPNNIDIFDKNISLNPKLKDRIALINKPVSNVSDQEMYYRDFGPGSSISSQMFEGYTGKTKTISIDDFVEQEKVEKVDFIKMDIEGAEPYALEGALSTIKRFRPKLAIAIYHSMDDFVNIPKWLIDLDLGYDFYLGHYTIHAEESVFFATPK